MSEPRLRVSFTGQPIRAPGRASEAEHSFEFMNASECSTTLLEQVSQFLDSQDTSHPFQFPQWTGRTGFLGIYRIGGNIRAFAQCGTYQPAGRLVGSIRALSVNRGPVSDDLHCLGALLDNLVHSAKNLGFTLVEISPDWNGSLTESAQQVLAEKGWKILDSIRMSLRLDLSPDLDSLLSGFRKVTRYEVRRCQKLEIPVSFAATDDEREEWLSLYEDMATVKHFASESPEHIRGVLRWLNAEPARGGLLSAHHGDRCIGGVIIVRSGVRCWYLFGATAKDNPFSAGHLLQWHALQWAKENGCREYDFGGYQPGARSGPAFFKSGFCQNVVRFIPTHRFVIDNTRFKTAEFIQAARRKLRGQK